MSLINKKYLFFLVLFCLEIISFIGYVNVPVRQISFLVLVLLVLYFTLKDLKFGLFIAVVELVISSKGYLFYYDFGGFSLSIRIAIWLIVLSVWLSSLILNSTKQTGYLKKYFHDLIKFRYFKYFLALCFFVCFALINGFLNNDLGDVFNDFNNWLYFLYLFPLLDYIKNQNAKDFFSELTQIFVYSVVWITLKTLVLLFIFSHSSLLTVYEIYRWIRTTGVGEITLIQDGFYRIFFQSHIFVVVGFLGSYFYFFENYFKGIFNKKRLLYIFIFMVSLLAVNLLNFSRSNWLGLLVAGMVAAGIIIWKKSFKKIFIFFGFNVLLFFFSLILILAIIKFPFPHPSTDANAADLLSSRARSFSGEAGVSSRWSLLPELASVIKQSPVIGFGFGKTVTYKSSDPRVLEVSADGSFTTYAFEWGWLDLWLKFGLLGVLIYLCLVGKIFFDLLKIKESKWIMHTGAIGLLAISIINFFSPYLNHPLGIGFLLISAVFVHYYKLQPGGLIN